MFIPGIMDKKFTLVWFCLLLGFGCEQPSFQLSQKVDTFFYLKNKGAVMPVWVKGNMESKNLIVLLHGGPGGSAFLLNQFFEDFTRPLEENFGLVYWEQRASGTAQGNFSEEQLTVDQYVEDLEQLVSLLQYKYPELENLFFMGISWGGFLGNAFLAKGDNQKQIRAWVNIVGPHDFLKMANYSREKLLRRAEIQQDRNHTANRWREIEEWCLGIDTIRSRSDFIQVNGFANEADVLMEDSLSIEIPPAPFGDQLGFVYTSPFSATAWLSNQKAIRESGLIDDILRTQLPIENIQIPSLIIGGHFDFVVPEPLLREQLDKIGAEEKSLFILPRSGHGLIAHETSQLNKLVSSFLEQYE